MSSSSLYGSTGNVTVSSKNITTLYNATASNVVTANVPDRNFTTLYGTTTAAIQPSRSYGNANVEAFLNAGTDGANTVQSIRMSGTIYVGGESYLGNVGNVHIDGGTYNYVLTTDGAGNLSWTEQQGGGGGNATPYIHFAVTSTGNNQQFTDAGLEVYGNSYNMNVFKNGVNIEPFFYEKTANDTIQVNILLNAGDTLDILASSTGGGAAAGGNNFDVQFNGGGILSGVDGFQYNPVSGVMTVGNITANNITSNLFTGTLTTNSQPNITSVGTLTGLSVVGETNLGSVGNITITGGTNGYVLQTDGTGNLTWTAQTGNGGNGVPGGANTQVQFNNGGSFGGNSTFTFNNTTGILDVSRANVKNGSNNQLSIFGLDNANGGKEPTIVSKASAGNFTSPLPLTAPYNSRLLSITGTGYNGSDYQFGGEVIIRYVGEPATPTGWVYGEPGYRYIQPGVAVDNVYYFENKSGGSQYLGGYDLGTFSPYPYDYSFNLDNYDGNFTTFTMAYNGNFTIPGAYNGNGAGLSNIVGANVTGQVGYAAIANSVSVANVSGIGNIATINLTGSSSNVLYGNGVFAAVAGGGTPGGSNTQFQYNNNGSFGGVSGLTYNGTSITANIGNLQLNEYQEDYYSYGNATGTITPDFSNGSIQNLTLTGNITINSLGNAIAGRSMTLILNQDATGSRTLTSTMKFAGGSKTLSTSPNATDIVVVFYSGSQYYASLTTGYA